MRRVLACLLAALVAAATARAAGPAGATDLREARPVTAGAHAFEALLLELKDAPAPLVDAPLPAHRGQLVAIGFTAPWCRRCAHLEEALATHPDHALLHVEVAAAGTAAGDALHAALAVRRVPALVLLDPAGHEIERRDGRGALDTTVIDRHLHALQAVLEADQ